MAKSVRVSRKPVRAFGGPTKQPKIKQPQFASGASATGRKINSSLGTPLGKGK